jgi:hypothetical protein
MDYLDPKRNYRHQILLYLGYFLIAIVVILTTDILVELAHGYGFTSNGTVIQNGLLYLSSQPNPASIYVNGVLNSSKTNTKLILPENIYNISLSIPGYRTWSRSIEIDGDTVERYVYPLLIPVELKTKNIKNYSSLSPLVSQSLNKRWLLVMEPGADSTFDLYDLNSPTKDPVQLTLPSTIISKASSSESFSVLGWSDDNQHLLVDHVYDGKNEYLLIDTADPTQSVNLSQVLNSQTFTSISLDNQKYDQYYLYDAAKQSLSSDTLENPATATPILNNVITYQSYQDNTILYATINHSLANKVDINIETNGQNYHIKTVAGGTNYLLNIASYGGTVYVAAGAASENKVYIYKDPVGQLNADPHQEPVPTQVLFVKNPNYLSFSDTAQFIVAESGQQFGVYDIDNSHGYNYTTTEPIDTPQVSANWMDGDRLTYVSGGKVIIFDYDNNYQQTLVSSTSQTEAYFSPNYKYMYTIAPGASGVNLGQTSLQTNL